ncbi:MAG TPA: DUF4129 domain-containing protein [Thermoanaerobaculia bacterium]|nr:DUF4129 domain-containing protein [Thermoanaerobaculia bacterium]
MRWLLALLIATGAQAAMPVGAYIQRLETIDALLRQNALEPAKVEARALVGVTVTWSRGSFAADRSLLQSIIETPTAEGAHRARLLSTIVELRRASGMEAIRGDRALLARIAAEQEPPELPKGGEIPTKLEKDVPLLERIARSIGDMLEWIREKLKKLLEWLLDLVPRRRPHETTASVAMRWTVFGIVALIVVVVLALAVNVLRRSRAAEPEGVTASVPIGSKADEDPLSRGATEWERYANELAKAKRFREAIRAWYHAVLVTCYAAGILHFRKGRTNWEYVATLAPSLEWRADMIELTRRFEREWYGSLHSTAEAMEDCGAFAERIIEALRREVRGAA